MEGGRFRTFQAKAPIPPPPFSWSWEGLMAEALREADLAYREGEIPVGAIIIDKEGKIISRAHNIVEQSLNPCAHAEILAIQKACLRLSSTNLTGCILLVTLEPCLMCASAISHASLDGLIFGAQDIMAGAVVSKSDFFNLSINSKKIWYMGGIAANPCKHVIKKFFSDLRK